MGVVAVYALNDEFKSICREAKNGMTHGVTYVLAKNLLTLPFIAVLTVCSLGIPAFVIMDNPSEAAKMLFFLYAALMFVFESVGEFFSILFEDPILGMLQYMNYWFASFLFSGLVIPLEDLYYPWTLFYYMMPFHYFVRSSIYEGFAHTTFESCPEGTFSAICMQEQVPGAGVPGIDVVQAFERVMPIANAEDSSLQDLLIMVAIGLVYKILYTVGVILKTRRVAQIEQSRLITSAAASATASSSDKTVVNGNVSQTDSAPASSAVEDASRPAVIEVERNIGSNEEIEV